METHGVLASRLAPTPSQQELTPPKPIFSSATGAALVQWLPYVLVGLVYVATSYVRWKKVGRSCCTGAQGG